MNILNFLIILLTLMLLLFLTHLNHRMQGIKKAAVKKDDGLHKEQELTLERIVNSNELIYTGIILCFITLVALAYSALKNTIYIGHIHEWLNLIVRWMHITFGIAWIGTSFFFVFMENSLHKNLKKPELKGYLWMLHGGGFWFVEKYQVAPKVMPKGAHWFKYEAYFTWLTGFVLLAVVYYFNAKGMLLTSTSTMPEWMGIAIGVGSLVLGYAIYHFLSLTPLLKKPLWFGLVLFAVLIGFAWCYTQVFNPRAAFIHFGALIGTMMAGNVFFVIIPAQKAMVHAVKENTYLDPGIGEFAGLRSFHNNYFTLPVLFVMISNHFPSTFGHEQPWLILALLSIGSAGIKHYLNLKERNQESVWVFPIATLILLSTVFITAPKQVGGSCDENVSFTQIYSIVQQRCTSCHSSSPTDDLWTAPPNGVVYDTPQDIAKLTDKIMNRVVLTKTMPQNNKTGMLPEERELIRCWIEQGAIVE